MDDPAAISSTAQAKLALRDRIRRGCWRPGDKLPPERVLADELSINRMSLRQALLSLESESELFRLDRRGWFVAQKRFVYDALHHVSFEQSGRTQGHVAWMDLLQQTEPAAEDDAEDFGISPGDPLHRLQGWGAFEGHRVFVHDVLLRADAAPDLLAHLGGGSITGVLKTRYGIEPILGEILMRPIRLDGEPQKLLGCTNGAPGLYVRRKKLHPDGRVLQIDREFWRHDAIEVRFTSDQHPGVGASE